MAASKVYREDHQILIGKDVEGVRVEMSGGVADGELKTKNRCLTVAVVLLTITCIVSLCMNPLIFIRQTGIEERLGALEAICRRDVVTPPLLSDSRVVVSDSSPQVADFWLRPESSTTDSLSEHPVAGEEHATEGGTDDEEGSGDGGYSDDDDEQVGADKAALMPQRHRRQAIENGGGRRQQDQRNGNNKDNKKQSASLKKVPTLRPPATVPAIHLSLHINPSAEELELLKNGEEVRYYHGTLYPSNDYMPNRDLRADSRTDTFTYKPWTVARWARHSTDFVFDENAGSVIVKKTGIYLLYAQILYHSSAVRSSYVIMIDNTKFVKCMESVDAVTGESAEDSARFKTCYVSGVTKINAEQAVKIQDQYSRSVTNDAHGNFFGLVKLAEL